ncbi:MAG: hypothetical protein H6765_10335 [Candidatus Peribacteria bacterium]|nr:MAG: hypothetical protein H6765_10335 [Candidatus Peribacteria bacterium]
METHAQQRARYRQAGAYGKVLNIIGDLNQERKLADLEAICDDQGQRVGYIE